MDRFALYRVATRVCSRTSPDRRAAACISLALLVALLLSGCSFVVVAASSMAGTGGVAVYVLELVNDTITNDDVDLFTVAHVPVAWQITAATFTSTTTPTSGTGTVTLLPGLSCNQGTDLPAPGVGRKRLAVDWGTFDAIDPQTGRGRLELSVGDGDGTFDVDFYVVLMKAGETACSIGVHATTEIVDGLLFADGFESGDLGLWSNG